MGKKLFGDFVLKFIVLLFLLFLLQSVSYAGEIHDAAGEGDIDLVKKILKERPGLLNSVDNNGEFPDLTPLYYAVFYGRSDVVRFLLDNGASVNGDGSQIPPLHLALLKKRKDIASLLINRGADINSETVIEPLNYLSWEELPEDFPGTCLIRYFDYDGSVYMSPLMITALLNDTESAKILIKAGASVNPVCEGHPIKENVTTAIQIASFFGNVDILQFLLNNGADLLITNIYNKDAFFFAVMNKQPKALIILLDKSDNWKFRQYDGKPLFVYALKSQNTDVIKAVINRGIDFGDKKLFRQSYLYHALFIDDPILMEYLLTKGAEFGDEEYLHIAAEKGLLNNIGYLIDKGFDVNGLDSMGKTPLERAYENFAEDSFKLLIEKGADVRINGSRLLCMAAANSDIQTVRLLLSKNVEINKKSSSSKTPLHYAVEDRDLTMTELLCKKGADVNAKDSEEKTPLHYAVEKYEFKTLKLLCKYGADVNTMDVEGNTPLMLAVKIGDYDHVKYIIQKGGRVNVKDREGFSPLHYAVKERSYITVRLLLEWGADPDEIYKNDLTCLHYLAGWGNASLMRVFIDNLADVNVVDSTGHTPLHYAALYGDWEKVCLLIDNGADINRKDFNGFTPLHLAVIHGDLGIIRLLVDNGADLNLRNRWGRTPLYYTYNDREDILEFLLHRGARFKIYDREGISPLYLMIRNCSPTNFTFIFKKYESLPIGEFFRAIYDKDIVIMDMLVHVFPGFYYLFALIIIYFILTLILLYTKEWFDYKCDMDKLCSREGKYWLLFRTLLWEFFIGF